MNIKVTVFTLSEKFIYMFNLWYMLSLCLVPFFNLFDIIFLFTEKDFAQY